MDPFSPFSVFLLQAANPSLLLPNLKALRWYPAARLNQSQHSISFIRRFLTPSLVSLDVTLLSGTDDVTLQSFFADHPFLCPNLTSIVLDIIYIGEHRQLSPMATKALSRAITHHEHPECLDISTPIDDAALTHIAMSPKLKKLALVLHPDKSKLHQVCVSSDMIPFRNVEHLSLHVWDLYFITSLLRNKDQMFRSFVLRPYSSRPPTEAVFALFTALASPQRTRSLQSIDLKLNFFPVDWHRFSPAELDELAMGHHLTYNTFRPLPSLCHLRELVIDLGCWFSIDDDDLLSLTRNWPSLRVLHLNCERYVDVYIWRSAKYVTFRGLLSLLECCPDLHSLCLPLDAREVPVNTGDIICNPALVYICVPRSPISDPGLVGGILSRHFPSVTRVTFPLYHEVEDPEITKYIDLWDDVNTNLWYKHFHCYDGPALLTTC